MAQGDGLSDFTSFNVFCVPTTPGRSRLVSYIATTRKLPFLVRMFMKMPEFLEHCLIRNRVLDATTSFCICRSSICSASCSTKATVERCVLHAKHQ